jgi:riboflavin synthase
MFTGIIEEIGHIAEIKSISGGREFKILARTVLTDTKIGDSIAVNGVCLTVTQKGESDFRAEAVGETLEKTTLGQLKSGSKVNLERALQLKDRLGGHIVQGHVNAIGRVTNFTKLGENYLLEFYIPDSVKRYIIDEGSITVNGISLTVAKISGNTVRISIIPHTWKNSALQFLKNGEGINIETDVLAKYIENLLKHNNNAPDSKVFSDEWFNKMGYR